MRARVRALSDQTFFFEHVLRADFTAVLIESCSTLIAFLLETYLI